MSDVQILSFITSNIFKKKIFMLALSYYAVIIEKKYARLLSKIYNKSTEIRMPTLCVCLGTVQRKKKERP